MRRLPFGPGVLVLGSGALLMLLFLGVGWLLPGTWSAERSALLDVLPAEVYPWVDSPAGWRAWTTWPDSGLVADGPARGTGARLVWNDDELGRGSFEIVQTEADSVVRYRVLVQGGAMHTEGTLWLRPEGTGTRVSWREEGDFGANPLMGYWARFMERAQGTELEKALTRLGELAEGGAPGARDDEAPADSGSPGASP